MTRRIDPKTGSATAPFVDPRPIQYPLVDPPKVAKTLPKSLPPSSVTALLATLDFALTAEDRSFVSPELRANLDRQLAKRGGKGKA